MNAQQTFIIEAGRRNSLEYKSGTGVSNSKWTNVINPILLKRGDYVNVDTAIINQKGAEASNNIEMSGQESFLGSNIQQNFSLLEFGFYLNRTGINDVGLPYRFKNEFGTYTNASFNTTKVNENDQVEITSVNNAYGSPNYHQFLRKKNAPTNSLNVSALVEVKSHNPYLFLDSKKYAKVNPNYNWVRPDINPVLGKSGLFTETVPIFIDKGFQNASQIGEKITQQLQFSNDPGNQVEDLYIPKNQYYKDDSGLTGNSNPIITQQTFSGKLNKVFQANLQPITGNYENENSLLGHLYCENPTKFDWGSKLLLETELVDLTGNDRIRNTGTPNPFNFKENISFDYPMLLWSIYNGSLEKNANNQELNQINSNYTFYSPSYSFLDTTTGSGTNAFYFKNFTGNMTKYNDWYIQAKLTDTTNGLLKVAVYLSDPNQFFLWTMPQNPTNGNLEYNMGFFLDNDNLNNDQMIIYNMFDNWNGEWTADRENLVYWDWNTIIRTNTTQPPIWSQTVDFGFNINYEAEGTSGSEFIYNFLNDPFLEDGEKYEVSFNTTLNASGNGNYNTTYLWVGGVNVMTINSDGTHTYTWTQNGDYNGQQAVMIQHYKDQNNANNITFKDFIVLGTNVNTGDQYIMKNILENYENETDKVKMYSLTIEDVNIKNHKLVVSNNTVYPTITDRQFTVIGTGFKLYQTGGAIYATNAPTNASYSNPVIMMYDDGTNQFIIGNLQNYKIWRIYRLTNRNPNDEITQNTKIGDYDSYFNLKHPTRTGQQYYDLGSGNDWSEITNYIDFELGNTWSRSTGGTYTATNHILENLFISLPTYDFESSNWTGGSAGHAYSFTGEKGTTPAGTPYDNKLEDTHGGQTDILFIETRTTDGLSGIYEYNGQTAGNTWSYDVNNNAFTLIGAKNKTINNSTILTISNNNFNYDYVFNQGTTNVYFNVDTTGDYKNGTYKIIVGNTYLTSNFGTWDWDETEKPIYNYSSGNDFINVNPGNYASLRFFDIPGNAGGNIGYYDGYWANPLNLPQRVYYRYDPQGDITATSGTAYYTQDANPWQRQWSFDINTGNNGTFTQIYTDGSSATYEPSQALTVSYSTGELITQYLGTFEPTTNPLNQKAVITTSITQYVNLSPPLIPNSTKPYYYTFSRGGNTYFMTMEGDENTLTGKQGAVYENDTTIFGNWTYDDTTDVLTFSINAEIFNITSSIANINYLLSIQYETNQIINVESVNYDYPTNVSNIGLALYGDTNVIQEKHFPIPEDILPTNVNIVYLSYDFYTNFSENTPTGGFVYQTTGENDENNAVAEWKYEETSTTAFLTLYEIGDDTEIYLKIDKDLTTILKKGWILTNTEKYLESREIPIIGTGNYLGVNEKFYMTQNFGSTGGENFRNVPRYNVFPSFKDYTINSQDVSGSFVDNGGLNNQYSNFEEHEFLLTNMKMSLTNLKILKGFMKDNEIYDGDLTGRNDIIKDDENFYCLFDIGRTDESKLDFNDNTKEDYDDYNGKYPQFQEYVRDHGKLTIDDGDDSNENLGSICPRMKGQTGEEQRFKVYTRYNENWSSILKAERRLTDSRGTDGVGGNFYIPYYLYGAVATEEEFIKEKPDEYAFVKENNIAVYPYWINKPSAQGFSYELAIGLDLYTTSNNTNGRYLKVQDLTYFGFSPSLLDHNYIIGMNPDLPALPQGAEALNYNWSNYENDNCNFINVGSPQISVDYDPDKNKFIWNYLYNPIRFNPKNGVDADLEQEVCFLNDTINARFYDNLFRNNSFTEIGSVDISGQQNLGILDAQCGVFLKDFYGQAPRENGFITNKEDGTLMTNLNYENCLWWKMGFSYFDMKPIKFNENSFNNRFNGLTFNNTFSDYREFGISPFTNNSNLTIEDAGKINIFGPNRKSPNDPGTAPGTAFPYPEANQLYGQPAFYLGFNNNQPVSIKVNSNPMISRSVIVNIASSFLRIMTNLPLDTLSYNTSGSLSCAGYMTKNYLSSSYVYSFSTGFGGYLTRDIYLTSIQTSLRNDRGLLVDNIDDFSTIFYKVVRNITLSQPGGAGGGDTETKENELLEDIKDELEENNETLEDIKDGDGVPVDVKNEIGGQANSQKISRGKLLKAVNKLGKSLPPGSSAETLINKFRQSIIKDLPTFINKNLGFISTYLNKYKGEEDEVDSLLNNIKNELTKLQDPQNLDEPDIYINLRSLLTSLNGYLVDGEAGNEKELGEILTSIKDQFIFMNDDDEVQEQIRKLEETPQLMSIKPKLRDDFNDIYTDDIGRERIGEIGESLLQYDTASFNEFRNRVNDKSISNEDLKETLNKYINGIGFINEIKEPSPNETLSKEEKDKIKFNIKATQFVAQSIFLSIQSILRNSGGSILRVLRLIQNPATRTQEKVNTFRKMTDGILTFVRETQGKTKDFIETMANKYAGQSFQEFKKSPEAQSFINEYTKTGTNRGFFVNLDGDLVQRTAGNKRRFNKKVEKEIGGRNFNFTTDRREYLNKIVDEITRDALTQDTTPEKFNTTVKEVLDPLGSRTKQKAKVQDIEKRRRGRPKGTTKAVMEERRRKAQEQQPTGGASKEDEDEETKPERPQEQEEKTGEPELRFKSIKLTKQERQKADRQGRMQELEEEKPKEKEGGGKPAQQEEK